MQLYKTFFVKIHLHEITALFDGHVSNTTKHNRTFIDYIPHKCLQ